jgi:hypothetical protein
MLFKPKLIFGIIGLLSLGWILNGCIPCYYAPNAQNIPLFNEKNDANISGSFRFGNQSTGFDLQVAHAVTNHFGWMCNYNHWGGLWSEWSMNAQDHSIEYRGDHFELGVGYFTLLNDNLIFETYGGFGWSSVRNDYEGRKESKIKGLRYFVQPAIGWKNDFFSIGGSMRFLGLDYNHFELTGITLPYENLDEVMDNPFTVFFEPALTLRAGFEHLMFQLQGSYSIPFKKLEYQYDPLNISIGLLIPIHAKKKIDTE